METSDMADYWKDFLSMTDVFMQNVHIVYTCDPFWENPPKRGL